MNIKRKISLALLTLLASVFVLAPQASAQPPQKPNILFIMGDDIGLMQPSIYHRGLMVGETPNIDRIGNEGANFTDYIASRVVPPGVTPSSPACIRCAPA